MKLSANLSLSEVLKSNTASRLGLDNTAGEWEIKNLKAVAENIFQPLRDYLGVPIGVTSGYRSQPLNKAVGGSRYSQHIVGEALDMDADMFGKTTNKEIFDFIKNNLEVHVSYKRSGTNRKQIKRAYRDEKGTHYKVI